MLIFPTPPTVMPSVGDGTGASVVQVPCAYPDCVAVKVASAPAAMARSHFRLVQERSNMFLPPLGIHERQSEGMRAFPCAAGQGGSRWLQAVLPTSCSQLRPVRIGRLSGGTNRASADVRPPR